MTLPSRIDLLASERKFRRRHQKLKELMNICGLKKTRQYVQGVNWVDHHWILKGRDRQIVIHDNPYDPSTHLENEHRLLKSRWRIGHLPTRMSIHVAGRCCPRFLAPPNSRANIDELAVLLQLADFDAYSIWSLDT